MADELLLDIQLPQMALLQLLADGREHSGQELANILGVSRTSIWKQLAKLEPLGIEVVSRPGHGYCIAGGLDLLSQQQILTGLDDRSAEIIDQLIVLNAVDSTNAFLLRQEPAERMTICLAECQTAGRGRRGRTWVSPFAKNIYLSLKITIESGINAFEGLSLAVGVASVRALSSLNISGLQLKWPNDLLWRGRKLGGILIEVVGDPAGRCHIVLGIGLNVSSEKSMQASIEQPWVSLADIGRSLAIPVPGRSAIVAAMLNEIAPLLADYEEKDFSYYRDEWQSLNAHAGQCVDIHLGAHAVSGVVLGVNPVGALLLQTKDKGEMVFHGGEVSLRGIAQ